MFNPIQSALNSVVADVKKKVLSPAHLAFFNKIEPGLAKFAAQINWKAAAEDAVVFLVSKYSKTSPVDAKAAYEQIEPMIEAEVPVLLAEVKSLEGGK